MPKGIKKEASVVEGPERGIATALRAMATYIEDEGNAKDKLLAAMMGMRLDNIKLVAERPPAATVGTSVDPPPAGDWRSKPRRKCNKQCTFDGRKLIQPSKDCPLHGKNPKAR